MKIVNFEEVLKENNENSMKQFLLSNGKAAKPHSPVYFDLNHKEDLYNGRDNENAESNGRDQRDNKETESI